MIAYSPPSHRPRAAAERAFDPRQGDCRLTSRRRKRATSSASADQRRSQFRAPRAGCRPRASAPRSRRREGLRPSASPGSQRANALNRPPNRFAARKQMADKKNRVAWARGSRESARMNERVDVVRRASRDIAQIGERLEDAMSGSKSNARWHWRFLKPEARRRRPSRRRYSRRRFRRWELSLRATRKSPVRKPTVTVGVIVVMPLGCTISCETGVPLMVTPLASILIWASKPSGPTLSVMLS